MYIIPLLRFTPTNAGRQKATGKSPGTKNFSRNEILVDSSKKMVVESFFFTGG
jgi:hypothetical protein